VWVELKIKICYSLEVEHVIFNEVGESGAIPKPKVSAKEEVR
jgi:hypothetical protein